MKLGNIIGAIVLALALLTGCGPGNVLEQGEVVGREYDDYDEWEDFECIAYGTNMNCIMYGYVTHSDEPHWYLDVVGYDKDNKRVEERHEVTETLFNLGQAGITVNFNTESVVPR